MEKFVVGIAGNNDLPKVEKSSLYNTLYSIFLKLQSHYDVILLTSIKTKFDLFCLEIAKELQMKYYIILPVAFQEFLLSCTPEDRNKIINIYNNSLGSCVSLKKTDDVNYNVNHYLVSASDSILALRTRKISECLKLAKNRNREIIQVKANKEKKVLSPKGKYEVKITF